MVRTPTALAATACCLGLLASTACSRDQPPPATWSWSRVDQGALPADLARLDPTTSVKAAGWSHGFVIAGSDRDSSAPVLASSADGRSWRSGRPTGATGLSRWPVAGFGDAVYVIGADQTGAALWRSADAVSWQRVDLPGSGAATLSAITAGPRGVVVVGEKGELWHSPDGRSFTASPTGLAGYYADTPTPPLGADDDGFVLVCGVGVAVSLVSADGLTWTEVPGLDRLGYLGPPAGNGDRRVTFGYVSAGVEGSGLSADPSLPPGLGAWVLAPDRQVWERSARLDPGRLPDKGVGSFDNAGVDGVAVAGQTFVAAGYEGGAGAVWTSPDGAAWAKQPTTANHFDQVNGFSTAAASGRSVVLVGMSVGDHEFGEASVWLGRTA